MNKNKIQDVLKQIKRIDISTKNKAYGSLSGNYYSVFKGQGLEFSEIREYRIGDDVRAIDKLEKFIPAKGGKKHMLQILYEIDSFKAKSKNTNIAACLNKISKILKKPSLLIQCHAFCA